jgi:hypothetical protein
MLDADLTKLYGVTTSSWHQAVQRNRDRFPEDFMFQLDRAMKILRRKIDAMEKLLRRQIPGRFRSDSADVGYSRFLGKNSSDLTPGWKSLRNPASPATANVNNRKHIS